MRHADLVIFFVLYFLWSFIQFVSYIDFSLSPSLLLSLSPSLVHTLMPSHALVLIFMPSHALALIFMPSHGLTLAWIYIDYV